jgi:hypothetical protein
MDEQQQHDRIVQLETILDMIRCYTSDRLADEPDEETPLWYDLRYIWRLAEQAVVVK